MRSCILTQSHSGLYMLMHTIIIYSVYSALCSHVQSCRDLKNFAGVFAIMEGLTQADVQEQESAWHLVTDHLLRTYRELQDLVNPDNGYHRYRQDVKVIYQSPLIPCLSESDPTRLHV